MSRVIKLISLTNSNVFDKLDEGSSPASGEMSQSRADIVRCLEKYRVIDGKKAMLFRLYEAPKQLDAEFDREHLMSEETGGWKLPSPEWFALQKKLRGDHSANVVDAEAQAAARLDSLVDSEKAAKNKKALGV